MKQRLDPRRARQVGAGAGSEEAVAEISAALPRRTVHEDVQRVLAEGEHGRLVDPIEPLVAGGESGLLGGRMGKLAEEEAIDVALPLQAHQLGVTQRVGLDRLDFVGARLEFISDDVDAAQPLEIDVAAAEHLVEDHGQPGLLRARDGAPRKPVRFTPRLTMR